MEIPGRVFGDDAFEVGDGGLGVAHEYGAGSALVEGVDGLGSAVDGFVESGAGLRETAFVHVEVAEFFEIADSGVDLDEGFELADALAAGEAAGGLPAEEGEVGGGFDEEVDEGAEGTEEEDDEDPVGVGTAADEVEDSEGLEDESPGEEEMAE